MKTARKTLVFHFALIKQMRQNYKEGKGSLRHIKAANEILRKYGYRSKACHVLGMKARDCQLKPTPRKNRCLSGRFRQSVVAFFLRADVSRILTGTNRTITRKGEKKNRSAFYVIP
jgi:hypothetical protein